MDNIKEFTDWMKKMENDVFKNFQQEKKEALTTSDGKEFPEKGLSCVKMILAGLNTEEIKKYGQDELFDRLAKNLVRNSTFEDMESFIKHRVVMIMLKSFSN